MRQLEDHNAIKLQKKTNRMKFDRDEKDIMDLVDQGMSNVLDYV